MSTNHELPKAVRHSRLVLIVMAVAVSAAALVPLVAARYLPLLDAPNHLGAIAIWRHYDDAALGFARHYVLNLPPVPYWGYFGFVRAASEIMPLEAANKLFLAVAIMSLPLGLAAFLRAHGRPVVLAVVALPLAWSYDMALGFVAYVAGVGALLGAFALLARLADAPSRGRAWACVASGFVLYFLHPIPFVVWAIVALLYVPRRAPLLVAPSSSLFIGQLLLAPRRGLGAETMAHGVAGAWNGPLANLLAFPDRLFDFVEPRTRWWLAALLLVTFLVAFLVVARRGAARDRRPWLVLAVVGVLYFALPEALYRPMSWWMINGRLALVVALVAIACVPAGTLHGWRAVLLLPVAAAAIAYPLAVARRFHEFDGRAADFRAVVATLPRDPSVLTLVFPPLGDPAVSVDAWREFPSYVQVERGGYNPWSWDDGFPMRTRPEAAKPAPPGHHPERFDYDRDAGAYEYLLVRSEPQSLLAGRPELRLVAERGAWRLWRRDGSRAQ